MPARTVEFSNYFNSVSQALDQLEARKILSKQKNILIKPNLVNSSPPPITTPARCCEAILHYVQACSKAKILIAEGSGDPSQETPEIFHALGYTRLAEEYGVDLVDLNHEPSKRYSNHDCPCFPSIYLPELAFSHYIISVPVLKAHSLAEITGSLKNMMGFAPPSHYSGGPGIWKKAAFHANMHQSIQDLNTYRKPDLSIMDATVGMQDYHLGGATCDPPKNKIIAGFDPREVDREAACLLGLDWRNIPHLC